MTRRHVLAGVLLFSALLPSAALAAPAPSGSQEIAGSHGLEIQYSELQYLATKNPDQRKQAIHQLKVLLKSSPGADAGALNAAVSAMLPAADSEAEADALLALAAAHPAGFAVGALQGDPADAEFLVDARGAAKAARHPVGDVEALADIRDRSSAQRQPGTRWGRPRRTCSRSGGSTACRERGVFPRAR